MKIILALAASLTFAGTAGAAISSNPVEKQVVVETHSETELAQGRNRAQQTTRDQDRNAPSGGKTIFGG